ncbi:hypothetical protein KC318_g9019, partial [Hortaea werneckii]
RTWAELDSSNAPAAGRREARASRGAEGMELKLIRLIKQQQQQQQQQPTLPFDFHPNPLRYSLIEGLDGGLPAHFVCQPRNHMKLLGKLRKNSGK